MNTNSLRKTVENAQSKLDTLLTNGLDTIQVRRELKEAQTELIHAEERESKKAPHKGTKNSSERQLEASKVTKEALDELNTDIESFIHLKISPAHLPTYLVENILIGKEKLAAAKNEKEVYSSHMGQLNKRKTDLETERNAIIHRRTSGLRDDDKDAQRLALIDADIKGLEQLIIQKTDSLSRTTTDAEASELANAQTAYNTAINIERIRVLREYVAQLETSLVGAAQALVVTPGIKVRDRYQPCSTIRAAVNVGVL